MASATAKFTNAALSLDSFLFQRRRVLQRESGAEWGHWLPSKDILTTLDFHVIEMDDGTRAVRFKQIAPAGDGQTGESQYTVRFTRTPFRQTSKLWFRCPLCERRTRYLYLRRGQDRFRCRRCSGLRYSSKTRDHNPVYRNFVRPTEVLQYVNIELLGCRSPKRRRHLRRQSETARERIAAFQGKWQQIAARVVTGRAGARERRYFEELVDFLLTEEERGFLATSFQDAENEREHPSVDVDSLCWKMSDGFGLVETWPDVQILLRSACCPEGKALLVLVAILTHEIRRPLNPDVIYALGTAARQRYINSLAQDPEALTKHATLVEGERMKRIKRFIACLDGEGTEDARQAEVPKPHAC